MPRKFYSQEILSWEIFCWEILYILGNFIPLKTEPLNRHSPKFCTPGKDHRQDQEDQGELMVANFPPPNICLVRSCAPNICLHGAEELGERMFAWEGAAGRTFAWASGAARSAATNKKKKKKKIFFPFYYITVLPGLSSIFKKILSKNFFKKG